MSEEQQIEKAIQDSLYVKKGKKARPPTPPDIVIVDDIEDSPEPPKKGPYRRLALHRR